jgi:hypothetical protein
MTVVTLVIVSFIWRWKRLSFFCGVSLLFGLQGAILLASAYSPVGLVPPQGSVLRVFLWFIASQKGTDVAFNQPMLYGGLLCVCVYPMLLRPGVHEQIFAFHRLCPVAA